MSSTTSTLAWLFAVCAVMLRILLFASPITLVMLFSMPNLSSQKTVSFTGYAVGVAFVAGPFDVDLAFRFVKQIRDIRTIDRMHSHAFAARDISDDAFAADRIAAARAVDEHVSLAADCDGVVISEHPAHNTCNRSRF